MEYGEAPDAKEEAEACPRWKKEKRDIINWRGKRSF